MKISGNRPFGPEDRRVQGGGIEGVSRSGGPHEEKAPAGDRIELSGRARELAARLEATRRLPEVRADKVEAAREALARGTYRVDPLEVARRIIDELV